MFLFCIVVFSSCNDSPGTDTGIVNKPINSLTIPNDFNFRTVALVSLEAAFGPDFPNIPIQIYGSEYASIPETQVIGDFFVGSGTTDYSGTLQMQVTVPLSCTYLVLKPGYLGLPSDIRLGIDNDSATYDSNTSIAAKTISKAISTEGTSIYRFGSELKTRPLGTAIKLSDDYWSFIDDRYSNNGKPESAENLTIDKDFLKDINNSVFKYSKVKRSDRIFLDSLAVGTLDIDREIDMWLTFIHESAGFNNTLGYYTYDTPPATGSKPATIDDVEVTIVFPNASYAQGSKGALERGDTVYIGKIAAGKSLGFVLIANGWQAGKTSEESGQVRREGQGIYCSESALNPETDEDQKQHASIIFHEGEQVFLIGMEDNKHTDNDYNFNDVVIAAIVSDNSAVNNMSNLQSIANEVNNDSDGDGVIDSVDAFPEDPEKTTSGQVSGTIAYEDQWPKIGDYDFNDLVIGYTYTIDGNAENKIVSIDMNYTLLASGAGYPDGLALSLPVDRSGYSVEGFSYSSNPSATDDPVVIQYTESVGSKFLIFKTQQNIMGTDAKPNPFNTGTGQDIEPESASFTIKFTNPISRDTLKAVPYDVFMLVDNAESDYPDTTKYGREVHLTDYAPTPFANSSFFNTEQDTTEVSRKRYYKSATNLPWAIHVPGDWEYTLETKSIVEGYTYFGTWAESGGTRYPDWYQPKANYKNPTNLYPKK